MELTYFENSAVSQSKLKLLLNNPKLFNTIEEPEMYFEEKKHLIIGSAVDCLLTQPQGTFENTYHVSHVQNKPSDTLKSIINQVFDKAIELQEAENREISSITDYADIILEACNSHSYQPRWNDQTRVNKICESWEYWEDLKQALGKQVLSQEENTLISQIVMSLRTNLTTSGYFNKGSKYIETFFQYPIYFIYEGVECKALLDMLIVDHENKTIQPVDIKTMGDYTINFPKSLRQRRYDIQAAFYTEALKSKEVYETYKILPFKFIVESTINPGTPLVFTCNEDLLHIGKYGSPKTVVYGNIVSKGYPHMSEHKSLVMYEKKGFVDLIEDYKWYLENGFEVLREVVEAQGEFEIDWEGII